MNIAVGSGILRRNKAVQSVVGKALVAVAILVVVNSPNVPIVRAAARRPVSGVEVIADGEDGLAGRRGRLSKWLKFQKPECKNSKLCSEGSRKKTISIVFLIELCFLDAPLPFH